MFTKKNPPRNLKVVNLDVCPCLCQAILKKSNNNDVTQLDKVALFSGLILLYFITILNNILHI